MAQVRLLYFGHLVEAFGLDAEQLFVPFTVKTLGQLKAHLIKRGGPWKDTFSEHNRSLRVTVNKQFVDDDYLLQDNDEIALIAFLTPQ